MKATDKTGFKVEFDDDVTALLMSASAEGRRPPKDLIESIVRDVLLDDRATELGMSRENLTKPN